MNLAAIKAALDQLIAAVAALEAGTTTPPPAASDPEYVVEFDLAGNAKMPPAFDGCHSMWEAAQREHLFSIHAYIGPGIQQGAAQMHQRVALDHLALETAIRALGRGVWGRAWLAHIENRAVTAPGYVRMFGFRPVEQLNDGTLREYD